MTGQPKPLRIQRLTLTDFRAFPGPASQSFDLGGMNLLVYGENGAGKSSLFYALRDFFALKPSRHLRQYKNAFSGEPDATSRVEVVFDDGKLQAAWYVEPGSVAADANLLARRPIERHPARGSPGDQRVIQAALRRTCLDYRALLDTNYKQGDGEINLFDIAVNQLIHDFPITVAGGQSKTVGELWQAVLLAKPARHGPRLLARVNAACAEFNAGFKQALAALHPFIEVLLGELICADVTIAPFEFAGVTYNQAHYIRDRDFDGKSLKLDVSFRTIALAQPQHFLNEGRLSALALAIYLGGRLACTPSAPGQALKLLVLDDVLIGLDHSNRLPVLDVLRTRFPDWQIVLLTHDHVWFEMARFHLGTSNQWKCVEVYEGVDVARGIPAPTVRPVGGKSAKACLEQARSFLNDHFIPAAANYTRAAFELALKSFCERFGVPVAFKTDPRHLDTDKLLSAVEVWLKHHAAKGCLSGVIERVKLFRKVVLNPYSHAAPPNIARAEVEGAIAAVEKLLAVIDVGRAEGEPLQAALDLIARTPPSTMEMHAALGYLRAAFTSSLRNFCDRRHVRIAYKNQVIESGALWQAILADQASLFPAPHDGLPVQIDAVRHWLISPVSEADMLALSNDDLLRVAGVLSPAGAQQTVLDGI